MSQPSGHLDVYFLLSHIRTAAPNRWVQRFQQTLDLQVQLRAEPTAGLRVGSLYYETEAAARDARQAPNQPEARVLVPLYTREYLHAPPPEYTQFVNARADAGGRRLLHPVFWDVPPGGRRAPGLAQARSLGAGIPDYEQCGLAAMCRLNAYATSYMDIVIRLAERIVTAAEHPERVPPWASGDAVMTDPGGEARFVISVIAPHGRGWSAYDRSRAASVAEHTAHVASRLLLLPETIDFTVAADATEVRDSPGVLLIDPWALDHDEMRATVTQTLKDPPPWVTVVLVVNRHEAAHDPRGEELLTEAIELASPAVRVFRDARAFDQGIEEVVLRTRRSYLRGQPINPPRST